MKIRNLDGHQANALLVVVCAIGALVMFVLEQTLF